MLLWKEKGCMQSTGNYIPVRVFLLVFFFGYKKQNYQLTVALTIETTASHYKMFLVVDSSRAVSTILLKLQKFFNLPFLSMLLLLLSRFSRV